MMFEECFSMIELKGLLETAPVRQDAEDDALLDNHLTTAVLKALEMALLDPEDQPAPVH